MRVIARYEQATEARAAARALLESGIVAGVVQTRLNKGEVFPGMSLASGGVGSGQFQIVLREGRDADRAKTVLEAFRGESAMFGDASAASGEPDLALLDPVHLPDCPACGLPVQVLTASGEPARSCESCGEAVDAAELIARQHGPEALVACYGEEELPIDAAALDALRLSCVRCGHALGGLARVGACPECCLGYDKAALVRTLLGDGTT